VYFLSQLIWELIGNEKLTSFLRLFRTNIAVLRPNIFWKLIGIGKLKLFRKLIRSDLTVIRAYSVTAPLNFKAR
jgi:hypothetical protein